MNNPPPITHNPCYTDPVANLTLSIDPNLLREARKLALDRNTSVNQMVRDFLQSQVNEASRRQSILKQLDEILSNPHHLEEPFVFNREETHDRELSRTYLTPAKAS